MEMNFGDAFAQGLQGVVRPDYKDPWAVYGEKAPVWANAAWHGEKYFNEGTRKWADPQGVGLNMKGHEIAAIGGKGSGKTFTAGCRMVALLQKFPGSKWLICANTYSQAFNSAGEKLVEISTYLGLEFYFRSEMVLDGVKVYNVYVFPEFNSHVCIASFENIKMIEGSEWDGMWFEEVQDCELKAVETAVSRIRRGRADESIMYCGMPDDVNHWMYEYFEGSDIPIYEPPLKENAHNLPPKYMERMRRYHGHQFDQYVLGKRISLDRTPCLRDFHWDIHVDSSNNPDVKFSLGHLSNYDPSRQLYISWDFNVNPLCVSVWQIKPYEFFVNGNDRHTCPICSEDVKYSHLWSGYACLTHGKVNNPDITSGGYRSKDVLVQVGEYEMFSGTTDAVCDQILEDYRDHNMGGLILGDSTGSKTSTNTREPGRSDWVIIQSKFKSMKSMAVRPGVIRNRSSATARKKSSESRMKYSNPSVRDRINTLNSFMLDEDGHPRISFLPTSELPSGGVAKSCAGALWTADGRVDQSNDKLPASDRKAARTHQFDNVGYLVYFLEHGKTNSGSGKDKSEPTGVSRSRFERRNRFAGAA
jgi:hypothetical protein